MTSLLNPRLIYTKAVLFVLVGVLASALIIAENPTLKVTLLLALAIWSFARAYYFAFYVIERYVDPGYRFAGLIDFTRYLLTRKQQLPKQQRRGGNE
jgi:hypothetical protein